MPPLVPLLLLLLLSVLIFAQPAAWPVAQHDLQRNAIAAFRFDLSAYQFTPEVPAVDQLAVGVVAQSGVPRLAAVPHMSLRTVMETRSLE